MSHNPFDETRQIFPGAAELPITAEYPAVVVPPERQGISTAIKVALGLLVVIALAIVALLVINSTIDTAADTQATNEAPTAVGTAPGTTATAPVPSVVEQLPLLEPETARLWMVVDVPDQLNVRAMPGTEHAVVATLGSNARGVIGTGQRASVNGAEWKQITTNGVTGWVSARFLAVNNSAGATTSDSSVCFRSSTAPRQYARLDFATRTTFSGQLRVLSGAISNVSGALSNGNAQVTIVDAVTGSSTTQTWQFDVASVQIGDDAVLEIAACNDIDGVFS